MINNVLILVHLVFHEFDILTENPLSKQLVSLSPPSSSWDAASLSSSSSSVASPASLTDWCSTFCIPWDKMPAPLQDDLKRKERPLPSKRRQMVRIIADEILCQCNKPGRKSLSLIASKIVNKYPDSFQDNLGNNKIGHGYDSLLAQLETRITLIGQNHTK